jgi:hypothetical protein
MLLLGFGPPLFGLGLGFPGLGLGLNVRLGVGFRSGNVLAEFVLSSFVPLGWICNHLPE